MNIDFVRKSAARCALVAAGLVFFVAQKPESDAEQKFPPRGFVLIQGGAFIMGSPESEPEREIDETQHEVTLSSFYMGKYEVTQREWQEVTGNNPSYFSGDNLPVENVSWYDVIEYCNKRSRRERLTPAYSTNGENITWNRSADGYRLPTEAEWEYACRAGTDTAFNTGKSLTTEQANYNGNYNYNIDNDDDYRRGRTTPAGTFAPNKHGLYDMHGNVAEWCWDTYGDYENTARIDPAGALSGTYRIIRGGGYLFRSNIFWHTDFSISRGGSYIVSAVALRSACRIPGSPGMLYRDTGFRLVRNAG